MQCEVRASQFVQNHGLAPKSDTTLRNRSSLRTLPLPNTSLGGLSAQCKDLVALLQGLFSFGSAVPNTTLQALSRAQPILFLNPGFSTQGATTTTSFARSSNLSKTPSLISLVRTAPQFRGLTMISLCPGTRKTRNMKCSRSSSSPKSSKTLSLLALTKSENDVPLDRRAASLVEDVRRPR